jgi:hypothetical protein
MPLVLGAVVRIYADDDSFDEGAIYAMTDRYVDVEFYDWQQRWPTSALRSFHPWLDQIEVLCPTSEGEVTRTFLSHRRKV